jgi:D-alanine-D-alanine ligase
MKNILIAVTGEDTGRPDVCDAFICRDAVAEALKSRGWRVESLSVSEGDLAVPDRLIKRIKSFFPCCVFNLFEGFTSDSSAEIAFARILERARAAFTGNGSRTLELCRDKDATRKVLRGKSVPVASGLVVRSLDQLPDISRLLPVFIKPCCEDGSLGIGNDLPARTVDEAHRILQKYLPRFPEGMLVEEFLDGNEYQVAVLGNDNYETLGVAMIDYAQCHSDSYLSYNSKWDESDPAYRQIAPRDGIVKDESLLNQLFDYARRAGAATGCRGYFRVDMRARGEEVLVLEVNPNPAITPDSGFMRQARFAGLDYADVIERIVAEACRRRERL